MKKVLTLILSVSTLISYSQPSNSSVSIKLKNLTGDYGDDMRPVVEKAFRIASIILNSEEFKSDFSKLSFSCDSYCKGCEKIKLNSEGRIDGKTILNKLYEESNVQMSLELRKKGHALGETSEGSYQTIAWVENIREDMPEFESDFSYALAVNLCHEYMHQIGFCHLYCAGWLCPKKDRLREVNGKPDPKFFKGDVTYYVGWRAFYILEKWNSEKKVL